MIIHHQKVIISPQKCALIPQNRSFNHISLTFSLTKMIYAVLSKNVSSRIYALLLAKFAKVPGLRGGESTQFWQCQHFGRIWTPNPSLTMMVEIQIPLKLNHSSHPEIIVLQVGTPPTQTGEPDKLCCRCYSDE